MLGSMKPVLEIGDEVSGQGIGATRNVKCCEGRILETERDP